jgi:hypothetical protein
VPAFGFGWALSAGSTGFDFGFGIATDADGYAYVSGYFAGTVDFDPSPGTFNLTSTGSFDAFAAKYSPAGGLVWATDLGPSAGGYGVAVRDGDPYVLTARNDETTGPVQVVRLDAGTGALVWATAVATGSHGDVAVGPTGSVYAVGTSTAGQTTAARLDPATGTILWSRTTTGGSAAGLRVAADGADNMYVTGQYTGTAGFGGPTLTSLGGTQDAFVWKLDAGGTSVWVGGMGSSSGSDSGRGIAVDGGGNVVVTGGWTGTSTSSDFDPGPGVVTLPNRGLSDIFVVKLAPNPDGSMRLAWAKGVGGSAGDRGNAVAVDGAGNVYATGQFAPSGKAKDPGVDFDPGSGTFYLKSAGNNDVFVLKLDTNGNFVTAARMGGSSQDQGLGIAVDGSGNVYTTGGFISTPGDYDPTAGTYNLTSRGVHDIFVSKLTQPGLMLPVAPLRQLPPETGTDPTGDWWAIRLDPAG